MQVQPYLFFDGRCEEAISFYQGALGAEVQMLMRYKDSPDPAARQMGADDKVMHAALRIGETLVMASDGCSPAKSGFHGFGLTLTAATEAEADRLFGALADGGEVRMPLGKTFFSPRFGMAIDRFGILWMILVSA